MMLGLLFPAFYPVWLVGSELIAQEIQKYAPSQIIEMFELDLTPLGGDVMRFHSGVNQMQAALVWQGNTYGYYPIAASGFDKATNSQLPRPTLVASNVMSNITALILQYGDLTGMKVTRKRTMAKYLDPVNFPGGLNPLADPSAEYPDDIFYIEQRVREDDEAVEFQLASSLDMENVKLPRRQIVQNICPWKYRGAECGYTGTNYFDANDSPVADSGLDVCGKRLTSCKCRFGQYAELPYGGFPGAGLLR